MALVNTLKDFLLNIVSQNTGGKITTADGQILNNFFNNITVEDSDFSFAALNQATWADNTLFFTMSRVNKDTESRQLLKFYNRSDFLNTFNDDNVFIGNPNLQNTKNKNNFDSNENIIFYIGRTTQTGSLTEQEAEIHRLYTFYNNQWSASNGAAYGYIESSSLPLYIASFNRVDGISFNLTRPLFNISTSKLYLDDAVLINASSINYLNVYAGITTDDFELTETNYFIKDDIDDSVFHLFRVYNKNQIMQMLKLFGIKEYYNNSEDLIAGVNAFPVEFSYVEKTEPGQPVNISKTEGGTGTPFGDTITHPEENTVLSTQGLMNSIYCITAPQLQQFNNDLWTWSLADIEDSFVSGYLAALQGCFLYPLNLPFNKDGTRKDGVDTVGEIVIGKKAIDGVTGTIYSLNSVYYPKYSFGILDLKDKDKYFGGFLDFTPYTKFTLYLPYIGYKDIDPCKIWNHKIELYYIIDLTLGSCKAVIEDVDTGGIFYEFTGQIGSSITVSKDNTETIFNSMIVGGAIKTSTSLANTAVSAYNANFSGQQSLFPPSAKDIVGQGVSNLNPINALGSSLSGMVGAESPSSSGGNGTSVDRFTTQEAYFIIQRPKTAVPENYNQCYGRPSLITTQLKNLKGFTTCPCPIVDTTATEDEKTLINNYLNSGVRIL